MIALAIGFVYINLTFTILLFIYGLVSKAYSHPAIRLKKYAITSWIITGLFQGLFTLIMCYVGINKFEIAQAIKPEVILGGSLTSLMLWANYPLTQVYQHEEDSKRGDHTLSILLGVRGTFYFVACTFAFAAVAFAWYFIIYFDTRFAVHFVLALLPVILFFLYWWMKVFGDATEADYKKTMWLNFISATCLNVFFVYFFLERSHIQNIF
jgi:1,4-dihydroxy-2-naphthoate octaprenyltransferase